MAIVHPLAASRVKARTSNTALGSARAEESIKSKHYAELVALRRCQLHPFVMETCGGMAPAAERLIDILAEAGEANLRLWAKQDILRELLHSVAVAVQRGGALSYLHGYEQALHKLRDGDAAAAGARDGRRSEFECEIGCGDESNVTPAAA